MDFNEIKKYFEDNADNEDVTGFVNGFITPERVATFLEGEDGKKLLQPKMDKYFNKGLETWKQNNLNNLIEQEVLKRNPAETPEAKQIRELQEKLLNMEKTTERAKLKNLAIKGLNEKGLPVGLADYFNADTEEGVNEIISYLGTEWKNGVESLVNERLKGKTPASSQTTGDIDSLTKEKIANMPMKDSMKIYNEQPELWNKIMNS